MYLSKANTQNVYFMPVLLLSYIPRLGLDMVYTQFSHDLVLALVNFSPILGHVEPALNFCQASKS